VDPYGQHWSPYEGMGNNPANNTDPDGGIDYAGFLAYVDNEGSPFMYSNPDDVSWNANGMIYVEGDWVDVKNEIEVLRFESDNWKQSDPILIGTGGSITSQQVTAIFRSRGGFIFSSGNSYKGSTEEALPDRSKNVGPVRVVETDNITRTQSRYAKSGQNPSAYEVILNAIQNIITGEGIIQEAFSRAGYKQNSETENPIDTTYRGKSFGQGIQIINDQPSLINLPNLPAADSTYGTLR
jgi:hypothetical protein